MINLLIPSYGRPDRLDETIQSARSTAKDKINICVLLEPDDPDLDQYLSNFTWDDKRPDLLYIPPTPTGGAGPSWNKLARIIWEENRYPVHMSADDLIYITEGWDTLLTEAFDKYGPKAVLHYHDNLRNEAMACNPVVQAEFQLHAGCLVHPGLRHFYSDTWVEDIARKAGVLYYVPEVFIEQRHFKNGLAKWDATYAKTRANDIYHKDRAFWDQSARIRADIAERIKARDHVGGALAG